MSDNPAPVRQARFQAPPGATTVLLIRHGESVPARADRPFDLVDGHGDPPLHESGHEQAQRIADRLAEVTLEAVYVTPLRRTAQTAAPLVARTGHVPMVEADLREVHLGDWEGGLYRRMVRDQDPAVVASMEQQRWDLIPGAERNEDLTARTVGALGRIASRHPGATVAVFTHGGVIGALLAHATGARPFAFIGADNGSISEVVVGAPRWILRRYNDTAHLPGDR